MIKLYSWRIALPVLLLFAACDKSNNGPIPAKADGWAPIYSSDKEASTISVTTARAIEDGGKIYTRGTMLYQVESGKGVHVIDISQPSNPQKVGFINIVGAQEMAIMNSYMYANNLNDLVVIDISNNTSSVKEIGRMKGVFNLVNQQYPPESGWFECVDATKGTVIGWQRQEVEHPKCKR
ncbi:hypothetical protein [Polluticoccus soli]|uniref:hypothetical protein n=1 Tax=Polluticoccus soli TaxID=3034150 RepID=UPI0023E15247|nr:hypothetical protein [Flavipsychrobacter sp. JY13-12]